MSQFENALPTGGPAKPTQKASVPLSITARERALLPLTFLWCFLAEDTILWAWSHGLGIFASVLGWYGLLGLALGRRAFTGRNHLLLLGMNLALGASFAIGSNLYFRLWNFMALLLLLPLHALPLSGCCRLPWWRLGMLGERFLLLIWGLFSHLGAAWAALVPPKEHRSRRLGAAAAGVVTAALLLAVLVPVLASADALFAAATSSLRSFVSSHLNETLWKIVLALAALPFIFSLLYALAHPTPLKASESKAVSADPMAPVLVLAALDALYLIFLSVQSAGLFGGAEYLASQGLSYAQWARSGFFQMTGVTVANLTVLLAALAASRRGGRLWTALRVLGALLILESFLLLASAAWRMGLYIGAYGLSFKRFLTGWGMVMMALFFLCALWKLHRPERYFLRRAVPIALCGWLVLNCIPVDHLVAKDQVDRYLDGESTTLSVYYLANALSYDTLSQLERLDQSAPAWAYEVDDLYAPSGETLADVIAQRRAAAQADCSDWRSWSLSAYLAGGGA